MQQLVKRLLPLFAALFVLGVSTLSAQDATLRGFIVDASDGQPLIGVNVILTGTDGNVFGVASDADGFYAVAGIEPGQYAVRASFIGFESFRDTLVLNPSEFRQLDIELGISSAEFEEVVIEGERTVAGAASLAAGLQSVRPEDIERIPVPGVSADLATYITQLPGVVSSGDRGGALFIRGGTPTENAVFLDGMLLYQPFHILGFYSAFPAEIVSRADIYAGGFGAEFGGRISSVIDISSRTGNKRRFSGSASISPFMVTGRLEGPIVPGRLSFLGSVRQSLVEQIGSDIVNEPLPYNFGDVFGKLHAKLSTSVQASITAITTNDKGLIVPPESVEGELGRNDEVSWENQAFGGRLLVLPATLPILAEIMVSYSKMENRFGTKEDPSRSSAVSRAGANTNFTYFLRNVDMRFGLSVFSIQLDNMLGGQFGQISDAKEFVTEAAAFIETEVKTIPGVRLTGGLRVQSFPSVGHTSLEPRFKAIWQIGSHQLSAAAGIYTQEIVGLNDRRDAGDVFTAWTASPDNISPPTANHLIAGYKVRASNVLEFSFEGYYKKLSDLVVPEWTSFPRFTTNLQPADGTVNGLDLRAEVTTRPFYGYVTYGFSQVEYTATGGTIPLWFGTTELKYNPPHDRNHQLTTMGAVSFFGFEFTALFQFGSGTPFSRAIGFDEYLLISDTYEYVDVREDAGEERVIYGQPYDDRLPDYYRLDLSLSRMFGLGRHADAMIKFDVINAFDRDNLFYLDLFTLVRVDQLPRFPSLGIKIDFR